ncbi:MAG: DAK2 domain-containing protein [Bacillota bacterium]
MPVNEESRDSITVIDGYQIKAMINSALSNLKEQQSLIDSLNVFPVPDGDTGTNMYLTLKEAVDSIRDINSPRVDEITSSLARGALMGARGNSGVILSQILRGFSRANSDKSFMETGDLVKSLKLASEIAYQGVLKPVEGTILTVSRQAAEGAELAHKNDLDISGILTNALEAARQALDKTPEQLPELKEAEVVDAGGKGYVVILEGLKAGLTDQPAETEGSGTSSIQVVPEETTAKKDTADRG